ncbi:MAG TPA: aconitate hydratase AcnA [Caldimonas sp.]|jgi:aconitate hydratase|nr:aconitate hydratase AcnA [Caldimonas sp.]HEX2542029.1 aconitate hydratase AcnA [Caldimonas sp.]
MTDSFQARSTLRVGDREYAFFHLAALEREGLAVERLPYSLRILLENLLRHEDGVTVTAADVRALATWDPRAQPTREIAYTPARVLLQDFTGVPAVVDLAAMRDAMAELGGDPSRINPLQPVELVIDHSVQVDAFGSAQAFGKNVAADYERNAERYAFLKWGQQAFANFKVVPPNMGICHQVNLEYLARVVFGAGPDALTDDGGRPMAYPDTLVGTDSHTPMVNGLGVLGWGVGGIEAEAAMLGQPVSMLIPQVIGFKLVGELAEGSTATDLVLTITEMLRRKGVVGKFVEFHGAGVASLALADRATIGNMSPEYGATCAIFPVDQVTLDYLRFTGRPEEQVALVEAYMKAQGLFHVPDSPEPVFSDSLVLDLGTVQPSIAGPGRPQDRIPLSRARDAFAESLPSLMPGAAAAVTAKDAAVTTPSGEKDVGVWGEGSDDALDSPSGSDCQAHALRHGSIVIAAITSCTNTSNPAVMLAAGLLAQKAVQRGLKRKPWVKTSLAPGSRVVTEYYERAGLTRCLDELGFQTVGYGCTTCIGNSGPLPAEISEAVQRRGLVVASVLSGNRNFEGRIHSEVRANFLMSPPLVVAFALAGRIDIDVYREPLATDGEGRPVFLRELWPTQREIEEALSRSIEPRMYRHSYGKAYEGDEHWRALAAPAGSRFDWDPTSTYVRRPPYFEGMAKAAPAAIAEIRGARAIAVLGNSVTTDHISPAGSIKKDSPAGRYLVEHGIEPSAFNSYGSRRGNHEVMVRGTFANGRIRNQLVPGVEGGCTRHLPTGETMSIYDAAERYRQAGTPLVVLAGAEYGSGSSRDWAAKGPNLQGIRAVVAESYERIHRSNLVGMGILPLQFASGDSVAALGLTGEETFDIAGLGALLESNFRDGRDIVVGATRADGSSVEFSTVVRIDTPQEVLYYRHGGILQYVLRQLLGARDRPQAIAPGVAASAGPTPDDESGDRKVEEGSEESFPASDPPAY